MTTEGVKKTPEQLGKELLDTVGKPIAKDEKIRLVKELLAQGADVNFQSQNKLTPLHVVCAGGAELEIVQLLIEQGADPNKMSVVGKTPLHEAAIRSGEIYDYLCGLDPKKTNEAGKNYIKGDDTIKDLRGKTPAESRSKRIIDEEVGEDRKFENELRDAIENNNIGKFNQLCEKINVNDYRNTVGLSLLHMAAEAGNVEIMKLVIAKGLDVNLVAGDPPEHITLPLHRAISSGKKEAVEYLLSQGADPKIQIEGSKIPPPLAFPLYVQKFLPDEEKKDKFKGNIFEEMVALMMRERTLQEEVKEDAGGPNISAGDAGDDDDDEKETPEGVPQNIGPRDKGFSGYIGMSRMLGDKVEQTQGVILEVQQSPIPSPPITPLPEDAQPLLTVQPQPAPELDTDAGIEMEEGDQEEEEKKEQPILHFREKGLISKEQIDQQIAQAISSLEDRIESFGEDNLLTSEQYENYLVHYEDVNNTFDRLGELLSNNKNDPAKALKELEFMIRGAQRECVGSSDEKTKAKLLALEKMRDAIKTLMAFENVKYRYQNKDIRDIDKHLEIINAYLEKTGIDPNKKALFLSEFKQALDRVKYEPRRLNRDLLKTDVKAFTAEDPPLHVLTRDIKTIKVVPVEQGKVVELSFSYDRDALMFGKSDWQKNRQREKMMSQVEDAICIAVNEFNKGTKENPVSLIYRPPEIAQPELALAMLIKLKEKAISENKPYYISDPKDPSKVVEISPKATMSNDEKASFDHFGNENAFNADKHLRRAGWKTKYDVVEKSANEVVFFDKPKGKEYSELLEDRFKKHAGKVKENLSKDLEKVQEKLATKMKS